MTRFNEFVHSPYLHKHEATRRLCAYLSQIFPRFNEKYLEPEVVFEKVFPGQPFDGQQLALVSTYLLRQLVRFWKVEHAISEGLFENDAPLLHTLQARDVLDAYLPVFDAACHALAEGDRGDLDVDGLRRQAALALELDRCALELGKLQHNFLAERQRFLDAAWLIEKLRDACELVQRSQLLATSAPSSRLLDAVVGRLSEEIPAELDRPLLRIYLMLYRLLSGDSGIGYRDVAAVVESIQDEIGTGELRSIFNHLQNYCIAMINKGDATYLDELFKLYLSQLDRKLFFENGFLPEWHYKNIVTTGLRLGQMDWVLHFIEAYRQYLDPKVADNAYRFNLANWHYHQGNLTRVMELLNEVEYTDLRYSLDAKAMLLRTYYDLDEEEALLALTESFRRYIGRNRTLSDFQKKGYFNLLKFTRRAFRLKMNKGIIKPSKWKHSFALLERDLQAADTLFNRSWLEKRVAALRE